MIELIEIVENQNTWITIDYEKWQATVAHWVDLRPLFEAWYKGYRVQMRGAEEEGVVAPRGDGKKFQATLAYSQEAKRRRRSGGDMGM